jgi:anti-sigma regulatory factor (Ser/Thr protein kinase)
VKNDCAFPNTRDAVTKARRYVVNLLKDVSADTSENVALIVSELATNCVRHASTEFVVSVDHTRDRIRVEVTDTGVGEPRMKSPGPTDPSGRGLRILDALSDAWGVIASTPRAGKTVWFTVREPRA